MIETEDVHRGGRRFGAPVGTSWRRAREVFDDYDGGGVLSEELADDLVNELIGLGPSGFGPSGFGPRTRPGRPRRFAARPGPQPSRPATAPLPMGPVHPRPRLTLVRGEG